MPCQAGHLTLGCAGSTSPPSPDAEICRPFPLPARNPTFSSHPRWGKREDSQLLPCCTSAIISDSASGRVGHCDPLHFHPHLCSPLPEPQCPHLYRDMISRPSFSPPDSQGPLPARCLKKISLIPKHLETEHEVCE